MPINKRAVLQLLGRDSLKAIAKAAEAEPESWRELQALVDGIMRRRSFSLPDVLVELSRQELKDLCAGLDLDDRGRSKDEFVDRILEAAGYEDDDEEAVDRTPVEQADQRGGPAPRALRQQTATARTDLDYADTLWKAADALRGQVDAAEYKHVVLGLLFLKYISDSFEARRDELKAELEKDGIKSTQLDGLLESRDEYTAERVFWVPPEARWPNLQNQATRPDIATLIDDAILAVDRDNPELKSKTTWRDNAPTQTSN